MADLTPPKTKRKSKYDLIMEAYLEEAALHAKPMTQEDWDNIATHAAELLRKQDMERRKRET